MNINRRRPLAIQPQIILLLVAAVLLLPWLGTTWFNSKGEPREAIVAVSMLASGDWILPVNYGQDIPFKPPFMAWVIALFAKIFNGGEVNEYISRLPSALAFMVLLLTGYRWSARLRGDRFGMIMALVCLTSVEMFRDAISCRLDMVLTAAMVTSMYWLYDLLDSRCPHRRLKYFGVIVCMTIASLTKGPVGALLPCLVMGVYYLLRGERFWPTFGKLTAICISSLILPALWFWLAMQRGGDTFTDLMFEENIGRLTGTMSYESHENPWWYNFVTLIAGMAPWTLLSVLALPKVKQLRGVLLRPGGLLALTAFILIVGFYCIPASKRSVYLLPVYPFLSYAVASMILALERTRNLKVYVWILAILAVLVPPVVVLASLGVIPMGHLHVYALSWWMWPLVFLPLVAGVLWMLNRRDSVSFALAIPVVLMLAYAAAVQPALLKSQSDRPLVPKVESAAAQAPAGVPVYSLEPTRFYTLNYYMADGLRMISKDSLSNLPAGTVVLYDVRLADTTAFVDNYLITPLTDRSCDHRHPVNMAIRK